MDDTRFDEIARALVTGASRRAVLRRLGAGLAGLGLMAGNRQASQAAPQECAVFCADQPGPRGAQCRQTCKKCAGGPAAVCFDAATGGFTCEDVQSDSTNCGGCAQVCEGPQSACEAGVCVCPPGTRLCGGDCVDACDVGEVFIQANCTCKPCSELSGICSEIGDCPSGGAVDTCQNGCCCVSAGNTGLGCAPGSAAPSCCSGLCGSDGRCA